MLTPQQSKRASAGGLRVTRALRLILLLVLALTTLEYLFGFILSAAPIRTFLGNAGRIPASLKKIYLTDFTTMNHAEYKETPALNLTKHSYAVSNIMRGPNMTRLKYVEVMNSSAKNDTTSISIPKILDESEVVNKSDSAPVTPMCESMSDLGPEPANKTPQELDDVEKKFPEVLWGGRYTPPNCTAEHKVAIIVPYRNRENHLAIFLNHMHPFLMKQQIEYGIYIVEQKGTEPFNRGKLINVGFMESQKLDPGVKCFIFHDVDLLPLDTRNLYSCTRQPRHFPSALDKYKFKVPPTGYINFGGVTSVTLEQMLTVNGFSNVYWGWGGEDNDMQRRIERKKYHVARRTLSIARYASLRHQRLSINPMRFQLLAQSHKRPNDGLSSISYEIIKVVQYHLYTHILANIDEGSGTDRLSTRKPTHVPRGARLHKNAGEKRARTQKFINKTKKNKRK